MPSPPGSAPIWRGPSWPVCWATPWPPGSAPRPTHRSSSPYSPGSSRSPSSRRGSCAPLARSLALSPGPRIGWIDDQPPVAPTAEGALLDALSTVHGGARPEIDFVEPTMSLVDNQATAALVGPHLGPPDVPPTVRARQILRAGAWSMVEEPGESSPYIWSHALTLPQAVLSLLPGSSAPERLLAVAATHVIGFRSGFASGALRRMAPQPSVPLDVRDALDAGPDVAAAAAWWTPADERPALVGHLIDHAAVHHDAHLVKYTVASLRAARSDPSAAALHLAAAASLGAWWAAADRLPAA